MPERNRCKEAGCSAACCHDAYFRSLYFVKNVLKWFPEAKKVTCLDRAVGDGVYHKSFLGIARIRIIGLCPNLNSDGNCAIYDSRPKDCRDLDVSSKGCVIFRRIQEQGLKITS
jgi:Fe-S-cluster containining protein